MRSKKPTYQELKAKLAYAEEIIAALRREEVDAVVGKNHVALLLMKEMEEALRESEERYRSLFEGISDSVMVYSSQGRLLDCNKVTLQRLGYSHEELLRLSAADIVHPDLYQLMKDNQKRIWAGEGTVVESAHLCKDGKVIPVEVNARRIEYKGELVILAVVRDITERKQAEEALSYSKDKLQILQQITATVHSTLEKEKLFNQIADGIVYSLGYTAALIILLNDEKNCFEVQTFSTHKRLVTQIDKVLGFPLKKFSFSAEPVPNDAIGTVLKGKIVVTKNLAEIAYPLISKSACSIIQALRRSKNYIVAPLRITDEVVGGLMISSEREEITAEELQLVETFAYAASQAITNASLHMETKRAADALRESEEKYRDLVENVNDVIYMLDIDGIVTYISPVVEAVTGFSLKEVVGRPFTDFVYEEDLPLIMKRFQELMSGHLEPTEYRLIDRSGQIRWVRSSSRPIVEDNRVIGLRGVFSDITERKQAIEQIKRHNRELAILNKITTSVSSTLDLHEILDLALSNVLEIAGLNIGSIYLMDHQAEEVALVTYRGSSEEFAQQVRSFKMGESLTGRVAQSGEPIVVGDLTKDSRVATSLVSEEGIHSFAAIPMKSKGKVQGVICIASHRHHQFIHEEIQLYISIADHIGIAIENARLYEKTKQVEEGLRESEGQKKAILDSSIDRIRLADKDMRIIWANQTHTKDLNMAPEDLEGKVCYEVFVGRDSPCPECPAQKALKTGKVEHTTLVRSQAGGIDKKTYLDSYAVPIKNESGEIVSMIMITRDITEQVLDEKRLRESKERYRELADSITDVFFAMDKNLRYTYWNKASEELTGIPAKNAIGKSLFEIFPDTPQTRAAGETYREVLKTQKSKTFMYKYHLKGKSFFFDITAYPSRDGLSVFVRDITKQKQTEYALWESEKRYRSLFNGVPVGLYRTTLNGKILDANRALLEILGYPNRETLVHANAIELYVNPKDSELFQATVERQGAIYDFETQLYGYDGTPVWVGINARVVKNADGNILYYERSMTDITERKMTEKALKESEERYRLLSENVPVILYSALSDETSTNLFISGKVEELTGYSDKQFIENPELYSAIIYPDDKAYVWEKIEEHRKKKIPLDVEYRIITKGNGVKWIRDNANPIFNEEKEIIRIDGFMEDITDRKQAQEALIESGNRFRELFDNMSSGVAVYEPINDGSDFIVKDYNKAGELISKVNKEHIVGRSVLEVFPGIKQFGLFEVLQRVWNIGGPEHHPVSLYQDDYLTHWAENYVYKLPSGEIIAVFDDVTERVQAEEELRCSQEQLRSLADHLQTVREDERTSIAREIHDELGQALTGLKMDLSWMAKKIPEDQKSLLDKVHSMSELTGTTLRTVQRISTELRPGLLDDLGLVAAAEWQIEEFQNRTGIKSKLTVDPEDITLDDRRSTALFRILQETLTNVARHAQATRVQVSLKEKDGVLKLRVRDNGIGITKEQISDSKSFGIIGIKERVHPWRGEVKISGRSGKGTTVVVRMPVKD